jgi:Flp pilus assembly protein TadG
MTAFLGDEDGGSSTIEALLWIPFLFSIMLLALDVSLVSTKQSMVMRIVQDGNRAFAISRGQGTDTNAVLATRTQAAVQAAVRRISQRAVVTSSWNENAKTIFTTVEMPASDLSPFGILPGWSRQTVFVQAQHTKEF